jgi:hypothetical protein
MTQSNNPAQSEQLSLSKRMIIGTCVGLFVILFFLLRVNDNHPDWGQYWMIRPLLVTSFAGAMAGLCNYVIIRFHSRFGVNKIIAVIASMLISVIGLWMGIVLGLVGTMWN